MFHQSVHPSDADAYAIVTPENVGDFISAQPFVIIRMDMENQRSNMLVLPDAWGGFSREMFVISASVALENTAERFNIVLETQLMNGV